MEQTATTILYDFWQFMFFATIFSAACAYFSYKYGYKNGVTDVYQSLVDDGVIQFDEEPDEDIY